MERHGKFLILISMILLIAPMSLVSADTGVCKVGLDKVSDCYSSTEAQCRSDGGNFIPGGTCEDIEIPEFPTAALPAFIAVSGYLVLRRFKK
jgi:hypothetical protein